MLIAFQTSRADEQRSRSAWTEKRVHRQPAKVSPTTLILSSSIYPHSSHSFRRYFMEKGWRVGGRWSVSSVWGCFGHDHSRDATIDPKRDHCEVSCMKMHFLRQGARVSAISLILTSLLYPHPFLYIATTLWKEAGTLAKN
jgi:hypothetical protein